MNKYYPLIARAVESLDRNADETRREVYERARKAVEQLRSNQHALLDANITKERLALEETIRKVEAEAARNSLRGTCAQPLSAIPLEGTTTDADKIQSGDHGQPASPDRDDRPPAFSSRRVPIFLASASDGHDNANVQAVAIGRAYGADRYYDDVPASRRPNGFLVMMAVLALVVLAGTFAYRGMFGGYIFPELPSFLKAATVPNNIVQNNSDKTSLTSAGSSEKLQAIEIHEASPKTVPRVISTISISSKPSAGEVVPAPTASTPDLISAVASNLDPQVAASLPPASAPVPARATSEPKETGAIAPAAREQVSSMPALAPAMLTAESPPGSGPVPVPASSEPTATAVAASAAPTPVLGPLVLAAASVPPPASSPVPVLASLEPTVTAVAALAAPKPVLDLPVLTAASVPPLGSAPVLIPASSDLKKIHLVIVGPDDWGETDTSWLPATNPNTATPAAATLSAAAAPLVGNHDDVWADTASSVSPRSPMQTGGANAAEVSSSSSYVVQVASERSAAEAHASFRALRAKFPNQLGGREPIVRPADLGAQGTYYRVMVGPFGSMEKAAGMCGALKAAGCKCLVQRI
jgi:SPOR domain